MALEDKIVLNSLSVVRSIEDEFTLAMTRTMNKLERNLVPLIEQYRVLDIADTALARQQIEGILLESGYFETTGALLNEGYQSAIDEAQDIYFQSLGENFTFAETSLERLNSLKSLDLGQYGQLSDGFTTQLTRTLMDVNFGAVDFNQAISALQDNVDKLGNHAKTWVTTGLSGIYSESSTMLAKDNGLTEFLYVGPLDKITRVFCKDHLNETKTLEEWDKLDNGQILPVSQFRGGFNCRHQLVGVR